MSLLILKERADSIAKPLLQTGAASASRAGHSRRNVAIDVLRGYCILMMITGHTGAGTYIFHWVHLLRFISGAEGFVFLAGLVLGMVYRRKLDAAPASLAYRAIWRRAGLIWLVHCISVLLAVGINNRFFHHPAIPDPTPLGWGNFLWLTAMLQFQPAMHLNILPLYVFLLGVAPLAFELLRRGLTGVLVAVSAGLFLYSQWYPNAGRLVHPICGGEEFPLLAWQIFFFSGLCVGYHHALLRSLVLAPYRRQLLWGLGSACALVTLFVTVQTPRFQFYNHDTWDIILWWKNPLRFGRVLFFLLAVSAFYLMVQAWLSRPRLPRLPLQILETLGRNSLYAFLVHLVFVFVFGMMQIPPERWLLLEMIPLLTCLTVYLMARYQVGRPWIPN